MATAGLIVGILGLAGLVASALLWAVHGDAASQRLALALAILGALWAGDLLLIASDLGDADGFVDCWPGCTFLQDTVAGVLVGGGLVVGAVGAAAAIRGAVVAARSMSKRRHLRARHDRGPQMRG